jgi:hypothetical protein
MADDKTVQAAKTPAFKAGEVVKLTDKEHPLYKELNTTPLMGDCTVEYSRLVTNDATEEKVLTYSCFSIDGKHSFNATEGQLTAIPKPAPPTPVVKKPAAKDQATAPPAKK